MAKFAIEIKNHASASSSADQIAASLRKVSSQQGVSAELVESLAKGLSGVLASAIQKEAAAVKGAAAKIRKTIEECTGYKPEKLRPDLKANELSKEQTASLVRSAREINICKDRLAAGEKALKGLFDLAVGGGGLKALLETANEAQKAHPELKTFISARIEAACAQVGGLVLAKGNQNTFAQIEKHFSEAKDIITKQVAFQIKLATGNEAAKNLGDMIERLKPGKLPITMGLHAQLKLEGDTSNTVLISPEFGSQISAFITKTIASAQKTFEDLSKSSDYSADHHKNTEEASKIFAAKVKEIDELLSRTAELLYQTNESVVSGKKVSFVDRLELSPEEVVAFKKNDKSPSIRSLLERRVRKDRMSLQGSLSELFEKESSADDLTDLTSKIKQYEFVGERYASFARLVADKKTENELGGFVIDLGKRIDAKFAEIEEEKMGPMHRFKKGEAIAQKYYAEEDARIAESKVEPKKPGFFQKTWNWLTGKA